MQKPKVISKEVIPYDELEVDQLLQALEKEISAHLTLALPMYIFILPINRKKATNQI